MTLYLLSGIIVKGFNLEQWNTADSNPGRVRFRRVKMRLDWRIGYI